MSIWRVIYFFHNPSLVYQYVAKCGSSGFDRRCSWIMGMTKGSREWFPNCFEFATLWCRDFCGGGSDSAVADCDPDSSIAGGLIFVSTGGRGGGSSGCGVCSVSLRVMWRLGFSPIGLLLRYYLWTQVSDLFLRSGSFYYVFFCFHLSFFFYEWWGCGLLFSLRGSRSRYWKFRILFNTLGALGFSMYWAYAKNDGCTRVYIYIYIT